MLYIYIYRQPWYIRTYFSKLKKKGTFFVHFVLNFPDKKQWLRAEMYTNFSKLYCNR